MTTAQAHYLFRLRQDAIESLSERQFLPIEIDYLLNNAIREVVRTRLGRNNIRRTGIQEDQIRNDEFGSLTILNEKVINIVPVNDIHVFEVPLTGLEHPYLYFLAARVKVEECVGLRRVITIQSSDKDFSLEDPFNKPDNSEILGQFGRPSDLTNTISSLYIYPPVDMFIESVYLDYLKQPEEIYLGGYTKLDNTTGAAVEPDISDSLMDKAIDLALNLASLAIKDSESLNGMMARFQLNE